MAVQNSVLGFRASRNGLHFANSWPHEPDPVVDLGRFGKVPLGEASNGLGGGMVYTVIDVFEAGLPPIPDVVNPPQGSPLFNYLLARLIDSFDIPAGITTYYQWMRLPDQDSRLWFFTRRGIAWRTVTQEWPRVRADIDRGWLSPLGLVTVHGADPAMLGHNHQVLAYGYELDDANTLTLHLYDPNTPTARADDVQLSLDISSPTRATPIKHNVNIDRQVRGFFRTNYRPADPTRLQAPHA